MNIEREENKRKCFKIYALSRSVVPKVLLECKILPASYILISLKLQTFNYKHFMKIHKFYKFLNK